MLLVSIISALLGIGFTYPSIRFFNEGIPVLNQGIFDNQSGDHLQLYYWFWLIRDNIFGDSALFTNPYEFNTLEGPLDLGFHMFPFSLVYMLFSPLGDIAAYNMTIWTTFVLTSLCVYLLVRAYGINSMGAWIAALVFTLIPFRLKQMTAGHLNGFIFFCIPLVLYCHERMLAKKSLVAGVASSIVIFALAAMEPHLIYYLFILLGMYLPMRAIIYIAEALKGAVPKESSDTIDNTAARKKVFALLLVWGAGLAMVLFYQQIMFGFRGSGFESRGFIAALCIYPLIFLAAVLLLNTLISRLTLLPLAQVFIRNSRSYYPLFLLPVYGLVAEMKILHLGQALGFTLILAVLVLNLIQFRSYYSRMRDIYSAQSIKKLDIIKLHLPIITAMGLTVLYLLNAKLDILNDSIVTGGRSMADVNLFSPRFGDFWVRDNSDPERLIYIGICSLLGISYAFWRLVKSVFRPRQEFVPSQSILIAFFIFVFLLTYTLALGLSFGDISIYEFCFHHIPFFNYPRVPGRMAVLAFLSAAIITAWSVNCITASLSHNGMPKLAKLFGFLVAASIVLEFHPLRLTGITTLTANPIYASIERTDTSAKLLELPIWPGDSHQSSLYEYFTTIDKLPRINGYSPIVKRTFIDSVYNPLYTLNLGYLDYDQYKLLRALNVNYMTIHTDPDIFPIRVSGNPPLFTVRRMQASPYVDSIGENAGTHLFKLHASSEDLDYMRTAIPMVRIIDGQQFRPNLGSLAMDNHINNIVLRADPQSTPRGLLTHGTNQYLPAGDYQARIRLRADPNGHNQPILKIVVSSIHNHRKKMLAELDYTGQKLSGFNAYKDISLPFKLAETGYVEFGFRYSPGLPVRIQKVVITSASRKAAKHNFEAEALAGLSGKTISDPLASGGRAIYVDPGETDIDFMVSGPNLLFEPGVYLTRFRMKLHHQDTAESDSKTPGADLTIITDSGRYVLASRHVFQKKIIEPEYVDVPLVWRLERPGNISFRAMPKPGFHVWLDEINTQRFASILITGNENSPPPTFTACPFLNYRAKQLMRTTGHLILDPQTGNKVAEARQGGHAAGYLTYGPYIQMPSGRYQARFYLKAPQTVNRGSLVNIEVTTFENGKVRVLSQRTIHGSDFNEPDGFQVFALPFDSTFNEALEFRTEYLGRGNIQVDKVEIYLRDQRIEAENSTPGSGSIISDPMATGGYTVVLNNQETMAQQPPEPGEKFWSTTHFLPAGIFQLTWRIKNGDAGITKQNEKNTFATLQVMDPAGTILTQQILVPADFRDGQYHRLPMRFEAKQPMEVTLGIQPGQGLPLYLDSVHLAPVMVSGAG